MALNHYAGFDGVLALADLLAGPFDVVVTSGGDGGVFAEAPTATNARNGTGKSVYIYNPANWGSSHNMFCYLAKGFGATISQAFVGAACLIPTVVFSTGSYNFILGFANAGTPQVFAQVSNGGVVTIQRGTPGSSTTLGTAGPTLSPTSYNYIEFTAIIGSGTSGSAQVKCNGTPFLTLSGINTSADATVNLTQAFAGVACPNFYIGAANTGLVFFDDFVMLDATGSAPYNTFLGDCRVITTYPTAAGALTQWTPLASTNVSQVQETAMDSDTTYNSSGTNGQIDLFTQAGISVTPQAILAVQVKLACKLDSAGGDTISAEIRSGGTNYAGAAAAVLTTYSYLDTIWTADPATSAAWTKTGVNALQIGYNRVT